MHLGAQAVDLLLQAQLAFAVIGTIATGLFFEQGLQDIRLQALWRYFYKLRHVPPVQANKGYVPFASVVPDSALI